MECQLKNGELIRLDGGATGQLLRCTGGQLWLTKDDGQDYVIRCGKTFDILANTTVLIEALEPAGMTLLEGDHATAAGALHLAVC